MNFGERLSCNFQPSLFGILLLPLCEFIWVVFTVEFDLFRSIPYVMDSFTFRNQSSSLRGLIKLLKLAACILIHLVVGAPQ